LVAFRPDMRICKSDLWSSNSATDALSAVICYSVLTWNTAGFILLLSAVICYSMQY
jgi:hypothetical protein